jgi:hypothetical protein
MPDDMIEQAVNEWMDAYTKRHLQGFQGEVLAKEQHWCGWLKKRAPVLIRQFTQTARLPASAPMIKGQWDQWIKGNMFTLAEQWRAQYH